MRELKKVAVAVLLLIALPISVQAQGQGAGNLAGRVSVLESRVTALNSRVGDLFDADAVLFSQVGNLDGQVNGLDVQVTALNSQVGDLFGQVGDLQTRAFDHGVQAGDIGYSAGNVGIGTTNPGARLTVLDDARGVDQAGVATIGISAPTGGPGSQPGAVLQVHHPDPRGTTSEVARFTGLPGKLMLLTVGDTAHTSGGTQGYLGYDTLTKQWIIGSHFSGPAMSIRGRAFGGEVGVGTQNPQSKFEVVGGDIRVTGGSFIDDGTGLNVPDFVFQEDYALMPLEQLRTFITREQHLPEIPSKDQVASEGLNVSEFQMALLQKIEELTLYTLQQQETLQIQRSLLEAQQAKTEALEAKLQELSQQGSR